MKDNLIQRGLEQDARRVRERILMAAMHEKAQAVAERLKIFLEEHNWTQTAVAAKLGIDKAMLSQILNNKYPGSLDGPISKITNMLDDFDRQERRIKNKPFIDTSIAKKIYTLVTQTQVYSDEDEEGKIGLIVGDAGHGKSKCLREFSKVNQNSVYVELDNAMNTTTLFNEIATKFSKLCGSGSLAGITRQLIEHLQGRHVIIILDEASLLRVKQLDLLRQIIVAKCRCPLILAGNKDLLKTVMQPTNGKRHGYESLDQFTSRLMYILDLDVLASQNPKEGGLYTVADMRKLYEFGGIRLTTDGVKTLRKICKTPHSGRFRVCSHIINMLHNAYKAGTMENTGQIDAKEITNAIEWLDMPMRHKLPVRMPELDDEEKQESLAKTA